MEKTSHSSCRRALSAALSVLMVLSCLAPAAAAEPIGNGVTSAYDEAYYATLDYYGNLTEGSVVKSYIMNGASSIVDYGTYDEVVNLTDSTKAAIENGAASFRFEEDSAPSHFYFEGKTRAPFEALPWTISLSYTLNGVPTRAEDLPGKTGVVEIRADVIPNENASDYAKHNYTLQAMALFNQDDILSLEAPGAQVQLIGNLRAVLFLALPGEEQHFVIRVGSEDFAFDGMTFLMVPATLGQLEDIAQLGEKKDDLEDDYHKLSGSMDTLLSSFASLGGSLRATADGLDQLNDARGTISAGKEDLYQQADRVLGDLGSMQETLDKFPAHADSADSAVTQVTDSMSAVAKSAVSMKDTLEDLEDSLTDLQKDLKKVSSDSKHLEDDFDGMGSHMDSLRKDLDRCRKALEDLRLEISGQALNAVPAEVQQYIKVTGIPLNELLAKANAASGAWENTSRGGKSVSYPQFAAAALVMGKVPGADDPAALMGKVAAADAVLNDPAQMQAEVGKVIAAKPELMQDLELAKQLAAANVIAAAGLTPDQYKAAKTVLTVTEHIYPAVCGGMEKSMGRRQFFTALAMLQDVDSPEKLQTVLANRKAYEKQAEMLDRLYSDHDTKEIEGLMGSMSGLLEILGRDGVSGDLSDLMGHTQTAIRDLDDAGDSARDILEKLEDILDQVEVLDKTVNEHVPGIHDTLKDTKELLTGLSDTTGSTRSFLTSFRDLLQKAGTQLDAGTKKTLENLALTLRRTAGSTDAVGGVQSAKDAMSEIIEDAWNDVTGEHNNLLLMDANAQAESLTSPENPAPTSVQVLIRTQEIKAGEAGETIAAEEIAPVSTFWGRVAQMFRDFWSFLTGLFH